MDLLRSSMIVVVASALGLAGAGPTAAADWAGGYNQEWRGAGRTFRQLDSGQWAEIRCGRVEFTFDQEGISTKGKWVLLKDPTRALRVMLDSKTCNVQVAPGGRYDLYYRGAWRNVNPAAPVAVPNPEPRKVTVPLVREMSPGSAADTLEKAGLKVKFNHAKRPQGDTSNGWISGQSPFEGKEVVEGTTITLQVSYGLRP